MRSDRVAVRKKVEAVFADRSNSAFPLAADALGILSSAKGIRNRAV